MSDIYIHTGVKYISENGVVAICPDIPDELLNAIKDGTVKANFHYKRRFYKNRLKYLIDYIKYIMRLRDKPEYEWYDCTVVIHDYPKELDHIIRGVL